MTEQKQSGLSGTKLRLQLVALVRLHMVGKDTVVMLNIW